MMKKTVLIAAALLLAAGQSFAQFHTGKGAVTTEVNFSLFNGKNTVSVEGVKVRYFLSDNLALKASLNYGLQKKSNTSENIDTKIHQLINEAESNFGIGLGVEYAFEIPKAPRLFPYIGVEVGYYGSYYSAYTEGKKDGKIESYSKLNGLDATNKQRNFDYFSASITTGFDFYIYKGLYTGVEYGFMFKTGKTGNWDVAKKNNNIVESYKKGDNGINTNEYVTELGFYAVPTIKVGWCF